MDIKDDQDTNQKMKDDQDTTSPEAPAIEADSHDTEMRDHEVCSRSSSNEEKKLWSDKVMLDAWSKSMVSCFQPFTIQVCFCMLTSLCLPLVHL